MVWALVIKCRLPIPISPQMHPVNKTPSDQVLQLFIMSDIAGY